MKTFHDLCQAHKIWVVAYYSVTQVTPVYLVWYTDTDPEETDRFLTYPGGEVLAFDSLHTLQTMLLREQKVVFPVERLANWLTGLATKLPALEATYDLVSVDKAFSVNRLTIDTLEGIANFINLFTDLVEQDPRNHHLRIYREDPAIIAAWTYYYDYIFWPRFNDSERFKKWKRPAPKFDRGEVRQALMRMTQQFEKHLKLL